MTRRARITSKGQITIPSDVRRALGVRAGDCLIFEGSPPELRVRPAPRASRFARYEGIEAGRAPLSEAEILGRLRRLRGR